MNKKTKATIAAVVGFILTAVISIIQQWAEAPPAIQEPEPCFDVRCCPPGKESPLFINECGCGCNTDGGVRP